MSNILKNNKGIVLLASYFVVIMLLGLSALSFTRAIHENRLARRSNDSLLAFYEAEAGISYAYAEASEHDFEWYTHVDSDNRVPAGGTSRTDLSGITINFADPAQDQFTTMPATSIDAATGYYQEVTGRNFSIKSYPEQKNGNYTGVLVILSTAEVNGVSRTIEYRLGRTSAYKYFFFYSKTHTFGTATFDGRNYGGIHVNGDIRFTGNPRFYFLTQLTSGSENEGEGYILRPLHSRFYDCSGNATYDTTPSNPQDLSYYMWTDIYYHFYTGNTYFKTGDVNNPASTTLPYYLKGAEASWEFDKYDGNPGDANDKLPLHYTITDKNLKDSATYELSGHPGNVKMFDADKKITVTYTDSTPADPNLPEEDAFKTAYNAELAGSSVDWNQFWNEWRDNHNNDYRAYQGNFTGGADWERRFYLAAYNWTNPGTPWAVNMEWWEDLEYGTDRPILSNDMAPAEDVDRSTGEELDRYFLNTKEQAAVWEDWLNAQNLDAEGENKTLVQDKSQGGKYVDPGKIIKKQTDYDAIKEKAQNGGVYIGFAWETAEQAQANLYIDNVLDWNDFSVGYWRYIEGKLTWDEFLRFWGILWNNYGETADLENPIADCVVETQFYNVERPARERYLSGRTYKYKYKPSRILAIDVNALKEKIEQEMPNFNGVVYVDSYDWSNIQYDSDADGVMLVNAERMPDGGLSIVTPNNVYIKGNYNLDPAGDLDKYRDPDDPNVIQRVIENKDYIDYESELEWQPAEIITTRAVYTLSEDFSEPQTMPLMHRWDPHYYQYYDQYSGYTDADVIDHPRWGSPGASWMPETGSDSCSDTINQWFTLSGVSRPAKWTTEWIEDNWGTFSWSDPTVYSYYTDDEDPDNDIYILRKDLKVDLYRQIEKRYAAEYAYDPERASNEYQMANPVTEKHIYNTAIVTPYSTDACPLELWGNTPRIINGAFIQLPDDYKEHIPNGSYLTSRRYTDPAKTFNYETRFGRGSTTSDRPAVDLTFAVDDSWREIDSASF